MRRSDGVKVVDLLAHFIGAYLSGLLSNRVNLLLERPRLSRHLAIGSTCPRSTLRAIAVARKLLLKAPKASSGHTRNGLASESS